MRFRNSGWTGTHLASTESLPKVLGHPDGEMMVEHATSGLRLT